MATNQEKLNAVYETLTPGQATVKNAGDLFLKVTDAAKDAAWVRDAFTPGQAGVRHAGGLAALLARIEANTVTTNAVVQNLVSAIQAVSGGATFDEAKLLDGIDKTVRAAIAEAVVQVDVNIAGGTQ